MSLFNKRRQEWCVVILVYPVGVTEWLGKGMHAPIATAAVLNC